MNDLFAPKLDETTNQNRSDKHGHGPFDSIQATLSEQRFAMIAAYSLVILVALGYVPGLSF